MAKRPHILIFNPDEMRADALGHLGNTAAHTPHLDRFAQKEAVSFANAYCQNPVCVPSRCSFMTGLYPHTAGHRTMGYLLHPEETSLLKELKDAGYDVWANARNDLVAGEYDGLPESHVSEMFYGGNSSVNAVIRKKAPSRPDEKGFYSFMNGELQANDAGIPYTQDDEDVAAAVERILQPVSDAPLCMFLGLLYPHPPYQIEEPYYSLIDQELLPARIKPEECSGKAKIMTDLRHYQSLQDYTDEDWDEMKKVYLGMCAKVDYQFQQVCDALKKAGMYDDTAIFFLSDHGDFTGDYGITEKAQNTFEDVLTRVPLLIKLPKGYDIDPGTAQGMIELVDFYATVMAVAEVSPSHTHFGKSLLPMIADRTKEIRKYSFCEGGRMPHEDHCAEAVDPSLQNGFRFNPYWPRYAAQYDDEAHAKGTMIRDHDYKLVYRASGHSEFYDLKNDPKETSNVIDDPQYQKQISEMKDAMLKWYQDTCDVVPLQRDWRFSKEMIWEKVKGICPAGHEEEVKNKIKNGSGNLFEILNYCRSIKR